jgi:tRNA-splicing ligase RtcB
MSANMPKRKDLRRVSAWAWELPAAFRADMRVPARLYADDDILEQALSDRSLEQLVNTATLPGIVGHALAMPDVHQGYGFPIGGVAATRVSDGVVSPGGVGYDINCGVRLLATRLRADEVAPYVSDLMTALFTEVPVGVGSSGDVRMNKQELRALLTEGAGWAVRQGLGVAADLEHTEDQGCLPGADPAAVSARALERGLEQVGTLGSGNHFLELDEITEIYNAQAAETMGLRVGDLCVWIHCGSRGLGHQVCSDYVRALQPAVARYGITIPDRELVCAPVDSREGRDYLAAMACAANYAWANRQVITQLVRRAFERVLQGKLADSGLTMVYDVCHNIAKIETHAVEGRLQRLCVHRKGATRAFGPGRPEVPAAYRAIGQPVLIPGSMGTGSYVLVGTELAMAETFGSTCHGAGRTMSRHGATRSVRGDELRRELESQGIAIRAHSNKGLAEEAPQAYKDVDAVVNVVHQYGMARKVARTRPLGVMKG